MTSKSEITLFSEKEQKKTSFFPNEDGTLTLATLKIYFPNIWTLKYSDAQTEGEKVLG